jgi:hypothetical protein
MGVVELPNVKKRDFPPEIDPAIFSESVDLLQLFRAELQREAPREGQEATSGRPKRDRF